MRATIAGQLLNLTPTFDPPQQGQQATDVNTERKIAMASRIERAAGGKLARKSVAVLGVTFKPDTDDVRERRASPSFPCCRKRERRCGPTTRMPGRMPRSFCRG